MPLGVALLIAAGWAGLLALTGGGDRQSTLRNLSVVVALLLVVAIVLALVLGYMGQRQWLPFVIGVALVLVFLLDVPYALAVLAIPALFVMSVPFGTSIGDFLVGLVPIMLANLLMLTLLFCLGRVFLLLHRAGVREPQR